MSIGHTIWRFPEVDSTQTIAFRLAELGAAHGTVVRADHQTQGRGRHGRTWESTPGTSLMFSMLLRPDNGMEELGPLSILVADALATTITEYADESVQIKWPNDVLVAGRKISGILIQARSVPDPVVVAGIGVNLTAEPDAIPATATSLALHSPQPPSADELLDNLIPRLDDMWLQRTPELTPTRITELEARLWGIGQEVTLLDGAREITGRVVGISRTGALRLRTRLGETDIYSGEITRGPRLQIPQEQP